MFTFSGRGEENNVSMTLRPGHCRHCASGHPAWSALQPDPATLDHRPDVSLRETTKGRSRQFHQLDVEAFGLEGPDIDAELIALSARLWQELGISGDCVCTSIHWAPAQREFTTGNC